MSLLLWTLGVAMAAERPHVDVGEPALLFALPLVNNDYEKGAAPRTEIALAEFAGTAPAFPKKAVVLFFFSRSAGGADLDALNQLAKKNKDLQVVAIATDQGDIGTLGSWVESQKLGIPVVRDSHHIVTDRYGVTAFPMTFVVDAEGRVASIGNPTGGELASQVDAQVAPFLAQANDKQP